MEGGSEAESAATAEAFANASAGIMAVSRRKILIALGIELRIQLKINRLYHSAEALSLSPSLGAPESWPRLTAERRHVPGLRHLVRQHLRVFFCA